MIRLGLCCIFRDEPIRFRTTTASSVSRLSREEALAKLAGIALDNADALLSALTFCDANGIGCFRVNSQILPLRTHPHCGYEVKDLPEGDEILKRFKAAGRFAKKHAIRTCFHPDQFVVLNSQRPEVIASSLREIEYQAEVAGWINADVINIHAGGAFGDKRKALEVLAASVDRLSARARKRLTVENDDTTYTPADLLPFCRSTGVPLVYDVHHHRVKPDGLAVEHVTAAAVKTWSREPLFHLSSPLEGWAGPAPRRHHDFIDFADFPDCWKPLDLTVEVEAKAKEVAVIQLSRELGKR